MKVILKKICAGNYNYTLVDGKKILDSGELCKREDCGDWDMIDYSDGHSEIVDTMPTLKSWKEEIVRQYLRDNK